MRIKEIMNETIAVSSNTTIKEAAKIMKEDNIGSIVILDGDKIAGIVTEKDIISHVDNLKDKVSKIMSNQVITIDESENIDNAAELMAKNKIKHLPVVNDKEVVGIVTTTDLIKHCDDLNEDFFLD
jgi:CBS domain-containing protein